MNQDGDTPLTDNDTSTARPHRVWMTPTAQQRLLAELSDLRADQDMSSKADRDERIRQINEMLAHAVVGEDPPDDGVAEPGMVLTIRYDDDGDTETFLLGVREVEPGDDLEVYSPASPLGAALVGASRGERRSYQAPNGRTMQVTLVDAVPYGRHRPA